MRIAILGGSFNPVHFGHLFLAEEVRKELGYGRILFIPAHIPVHKDLEPLSEARHRLAMLRLALAPCPAFTADDCELKRGGDSYTIDTVRELIARHPGCGRPGLVLGDDLAEGFSKWRDVEGLLKLTDLILARRSADDKVPFPYPCTRLRNPLLEISSSEIRQRIHEGRAVRFLTPEPVLRYIEEHGLYV